MIHDLEKYFVYFYILSFFILIAIMVVYKKEKNMNKWIIIIASIILIIQLFILYNTYPYMEHMKTGDINADVQSYVDSVNNNAYLKQYLIDTTSATGIYPTTKAINDKYPNQKPILDIVNTYTGGNYTSIASLPGAPYHLTTFTPAQIGNMMIGIQEKYINALQNIVKLTTPIPDEKIPDYYAKKY